ncbi:S-layer homology domain-containing protein [Paenibacillus sp. GSMTC-2017]|uniref:S-layer homology domain-containing protein n=1 Tax=Paenibacillus sp. GSMTC-2017 TaxID=2794350 RepID=UPI0018D87E4A|nr:S-layer homology domain-containing protein [Paenibacillus sp. GSMTC-2017]MBH5317894.1 S-layer homology domain-containing protein [Paenibacillus sp. GSMTC-2017]
MPLHETWKKVVTGALVFTLVTGSGATVLSVPSTISAATVAATPFTDVSAGYYAEKHIAKLYYQGIIDGYKNNVDQTSTFKPEKGVSQQEAVLMALRFAGLDHLVDNSSMIVFGESFVVSGFFKAYIELAFNKGLLDRDEEYALAAADKTSEWGLKPASREWVTKLIVKAIGQQAAATKLQHAESHFSDAASVDARYKGYVNAAVQLGLVKGLTETTFGPDVAVKRAALATLFSRAQSSYAVEYEGQVDGIISEIKDDKITVYSKETDTNYTIDNNTVYYHYKSEKPVTKETLLKYSDVTVIAKEGKALYVEAKGDTQHTVTIDGTFARYNADEGVIYLWIKDKPVPINYAAGIVIEDTTGKQLAITDLKANSQITIVQDSFRTKPVALKIIAAATPTVTVATGKLIESTQKLVVIKTTEGLVTKYVAPGATVEISGLSNATITDLVASEEAGDQVEVSLNAADQITKVKVTSREVKVVAAAEIFNINEAKKVITVMDSNGEPIALTLTDKTKFDYMGNNVDMKTALGLISTNVNVIIRYTHKNLISMHFVMSYTGTVNSVDTKNKILTIQTEHGVSAKIPYANYVVDYFGRPLATHTDLKTGDSVTLRMKPDKIEAIIISVNQTIQYEVVSVNVLANKVTVKTAVNDTFEYSMQDVQLLKVDGTKTTIGQLTAGTLVNLSYVGTAVVKLQETKKA